jgi:hypothetical protein
MLGMIDPPGGEGRTIRIFHGDQTPDASALPDWIDAGGK